PKFHFLFPHIAVITGISWDHINVFHTFDFYLEQFIIFIKQLETKGILIYNETDAILKKLVEENLRKEITYIPYHLPDHTIENGVTTVTIENEKTGLKIFGNHNLLNLQAAYDVCKELGMAEASFAKGIATFEGAAKRLELIIVKNYGNIYRDF